MHPLPKEVTDRIKKEAEEYAKSRLKTQFPYAPLVIESYITGAEKEAQRNKEDAKTESIEFTKWILREQTYMVDDSDLGTWWNIETGKNGIITTEQLYELFKTKKDA